MKNTLFLLIFLLSLQGTSILADEEPGPTAYVGATMIGGASMNPVPNSVILVDEGRIVSAGQKSDVIIPRGASIVDVTGKWITPGMVDAHSHFMESGRIYTMPRKMDFTHVVSYDEEVAWMRSRLPIALQSFVCAGVTSTLSAGGARIEYDARAMSREQLHAPNVFVAHGPISLVPSEALFPPFEGDTGLRSVSSPEDGALRVREASEWGADLIKTAYLGGPFEDIENEYVALHKTIVKEAKVYGFLVTSHATEVEVARNLIRVGVDSLQHVPSDTLIDNLFVEEAKKNGVIVVPTLAVHRRLNKELPTQTIELLPIERKCGDPEVIKSWTAVKLSPPSQDTLRSIEDRLDNAKSNTAKLYRGGVTIAAGSDAGVPGLLYGSSLHYELKLLSDIGMSNSDLIKAATLNAAKVAGKDNLVGSIESGKLADFLILNANPLDDISNLQKIETVVKHGIAINQRDLLPPIAREQKVGCVECEWSGNSATN